MTYMSVAVPDQAENSRCFPVSQHSSAGRGLDFFLANFTYTDMNSNFGITLRPSNFISLEGCQQEQTRTIGHTKPLHSLLQS